MYVGNLHICVSMDVPCLVVMVTGNFVHHICDQLRDLKSFLDIGVPEEHAFQQLFEDSKRGGPTTCPPGRRQRSVKCFMSLAIFEC